MAVFTPINPEDASRIANAHQLAPPDQVIGVAAGSVNSNFFLQWNRPLRRVFCRVYEEQGPLGVAHEWALLAHLRRNGIPCPQPLGGVLPGEVTHGGKPVGLFECIGGEMSCQKAVTATRALRMGALLGRVHNVGASFPWKRQGRFEVSDLDKRLRWIKQQAPGGPAQDALGGHVHQLQEHLVALGQVVWGQGVHTCIHSDLFRDNVHWEGDRIVGVLDWESASLGLRVYDLAVLLLAWCYADTFDWELGRALVQGYQTHVSLTSGEKQLLMPALRMACVRFAITRITDFHLRQGVGERTHKDYTRFFLRLEELESLGEAEMNRLLGL